MPVAQVNDKGIELAYLDSGVPTSGGNFTTLVIIHGYCWSGDIFQKVIDIAPSRGVRIIALNRRDYTGSSPFTPEEMAPIRAEDCNAVTLKAFLRDRSEEYAGFLKHIIDGGGVTKPIGKKGGIALMAWSLGNVFGLNFLENVTFLPAPLKELVTTYVRSFILFDPPFEAVALPPPAPQYSEWSNKILARFIDPTDPGNLTNLMDGVKAINNWFTGWYSYTDTSLDPVVRFVRAKELQGPTGTKETTRDKEQTNTNFTDCNVSGAFTNENTIMKGIYNDVFNSTARSLVLSKDGAAKLWPGMEIKYIYCENSCWTCVYAAETTKKSFEGNGRKVEVIRNANHFVQWEDPELFINGVLPVL
ncbi:alpha/beta-hydrolase [Rickenella mellea]|uniref:Alpha/beta-hydrolase n=1 Tax=Rickenella mellea TaxID=50990 RepID=A0A4Y7QHT5_9AGAM|nr:alpha/beta-hydrolase [Rickenella mellea]